MDTSETKVEIYLAEVTLNKGYPAEKMIVIENEDSYLFINKELYTASFDKVLEPDIEIQKLDNICYLTFIL